jgi:hypothetical protein
LKPGPELGQILGAVHDRILAGEITTRKAATAAAKELIISRREQRSDNGQGTDS